MAIFKLTVLQQTIEIAPHSQLVILEYRHGYLQRLQAGEDCLGIRLGAP
jgi:hypothetical protein